MNYLSMGIPSNYISHPLYQQYAQLLMQSAQMTQNMMLQKQQELAKQNALYQQRAQAQAEALEKQQELEALAAAEQEAKIAQAEQQAMAAIGPKDGKDDGKISFGSKIKNLGKGVVNFFKGMVCDENGKFSITRTLTTAAIAAGAVALTVATSGAATPFLIAAGTTLGAVEVGKGAYKAATAKTDAEADAAWQNIGSGATAIVGSVAGAKSALKSAKVDVSGYKGVSGALKATGKTFKYSYDKTGSGISYVKNNGYGKSFRAAKDSLTNNFKAGWEATFKSTNAKENVKAKFEAKYDDKIAKIDTKSDALAKEIAILEKDPIKNKAKISKKRNQLKALLHDRTVLNSRKSQIPVDVTVKNNQAKIAELTADIEELKFISQTLPEAGVESELALKIAQRNRLINQQTTSGIRKMQMEELKANKANIETAKKVTKSKSMQKAIQKQLDNTNARIAEVEKFTQLEETQQAVSTLKTKLARRENAVKDLTTEIQKLKNSTTISANDKTKKLVELTAKLEKATEILNGTKTKLAQAKRSLHLENAKLFEAANRKSVGYPTVSIVGGGVTTQDQVNAADEYAKAFGYNSAAEMQKYLEAQNAQYSQALASNNAQAQSLNNSNAATNPYLAKNIFANNGSSLLGFNDLYVSPYPEYAI